MQDQWALLAEVFNARGALLAFFGGLGGGVRWAVDGGRWRVGARRVFIGAATAFGVGLMAPVQLEPWIGSVQPEARASIGTLCGTAFLVGFLALSVLERIMNSAGMVPDPKKPPGPPRR